MYPIPDPPCMRPPPPPKELIVQSAQSAQSAQSSKKESKTSAQRYFKMRQKEKRKELETEIQNRFKEELEETRKKAVQSRRDRRKMMDIQREAQRIHERTMNERSVLALEKIGLASEKIVIEGLARSANEKLKNAKFNEETAVEKMKRVIAKEEEFNRKIKETLEDVKSGKLDGSVPVEIKLELGEKENECPVCFFNPPNAAFQCGHMSCFDCAMDIYDRKMGCPICRVEQYKEPMRVYFNA